jgi:predicted nucleotidyltransferase
MTTLERVKGTLAQLKPELADKYGVSSIGLFGSVVRDDFTATSDIDIVVDFSRPIGIEFVDMADYIEQVLKQRVDVISRNGIKPKYFNAIESEIIYV